MRSDIKKIKGFKRAYIQKLEGEFVNDASFYYYNGLKFLNIPVTFFNEDSDYKLELDRETLVVAGVPTTLKVFKELGIEPPKPLDIPEELNQPFSYLGREIAFTTIGDVLNDNVNTKFNLLKDKETNKIRYPLFVKPSEHGKLFNGQLVFCKEELEMFRYCHRELDLNIPIMISSRMDFASEYRCFILEGEILDIRKYRGDYEVTPNFHQIKQMVKAYKSAPIAYALDVGVLGNGDTFVVECNDAYSLGPYGFDNFNLTRMFIMRWKQIIGA